MDFDNVLANMADTHALMLATTEMLNSLEKATMDSRTNKIADRVVAYELSRVIGSLVTLNAMAFNHLEEANSHLEAMDAEANRE